MSSSAKRSEPPLADRLDSARLRRVAEEFPAEQQPHVVASTAILRTYKILTTRIEAELEVLGLTMARYEILGLLATGPKAGMSLTDLSRATILHPATMTYTISGLEKRKLIRRRIKPSDKRVALAEITPLGRKVLASATAALAAIDFGLPDLGVDDAVEVGIRLSRIQPTVDEIRDPRASTAI